MSKLRFEYYSKKIAENRSDIKATWKVLKEAMKTEPKQSYFSVISGNKEDITDEQKISERRNFGSDHFVCLGEKLASDIPSSSSSSSDYLSKVKTNGAKFKFQVIKSTDVYKILSKLKNGKATGMHLIPNKILKSVKEIIANSLSDVFNASILTKIFPDEFKIARVTPLFKGGETEDIGNYRPISILALVARSFEKLLYKQLYDFLSKNEILSSQQWGFRSLHSTALVLIDCFANWLINMDKGETNLAVFLDIKKALDTIDHEILLNKLNYYGISDAVLQFFGFYLRNRKQCCNMNNYKPSVKPKSMVFHKVPYLDRCYLSYT